MVTLAMLAAAAMVAVVTTTTTMTRTAPLRAHPKHVAVVLAHDDSFPHAFGRRPKAHCRALRMPEGAARALGRVLQTTVWPVPALPA